MMARIPSVPKRRGHGELLKDADVVVPAQQKLSAISPSPRKTLLRPRGASIHSKTAGPVSAPWAGDSHWGRKESRWSSKKGRLAKTSGETLQLPLIDKSSNVAPGIQLELDPCDRLGHHTYNGKHLSNARGHRDSVDSTASTVASWTDQLMALGASKKSHEPEDQRITGSLPLVVPVTANQCSSIQEDLNEREAVVDHTLRPPSTRPATSDGGSSTRSTRSVHFKLVNGHLLPLKDRLVKESESLTEMCRECADAPCDVCDLTAANLAKLESKTSSEFGKPDFGRSRKKQKSPKKARRFKSGSSGKSHHSKSASEGKSVSPKSAKSAKSVKSTKSSLSDGSVVSGVSFKAIGRVMQAIHAFQRPLRQCHHAHRGRYECQYCFDDLAARPVAILMGDSDQRSCKHLYHQDCCAAMQERVNKNGAIRRARCPCCKKAFASYVNLPDPETDTEMWFNALDYTHCGKVNKNDVMDHLMAALQVKTALRDSLAPAPEKINLSSCKALIERLNGSSNKNRRRPPPKSPDIETHPSEWFAFWDIYEDGTLDRCQATRALMKTFTKYDKLLLRAAIDDVWPQIVASGCEAENSEKESVTKDQIFQPTTGLVDKVLRKVQAAFHWKLLQEFNPG